MHYDLQKELMEDSIEIVIEKLFHATKDMVAEVLYFLLQVIVAFVILNFVVHVVHTTFISFYLFNSFYRSQMKHTTV